ncbi:MAG: glycoside hydrolase family 2 protein [Flavobacteriales bacterium]|nr:glycoside hydrolase family 2 protein [Flavobacteriales bacterium]
MFDRIARRPTFTYLLSRAVASTISGLAFAITIAAQVTHVPLDSNWRFRQADTERWFSAEVPGVVHTDLLRHGLIPDPYVNFNADSVQWIENKDWAYTRTITADRTLLRNEHIDLVFKGLDTFAEVYLNNALLGKADNMFRTWEWPIKKKLRRGANELKVIFRSPIAEGKTLREAYSLQLPHDNDPSGASPYARKAAYQFGWDFAPRLVSSGIWQPVELRCWNKSRITALQVRQQFDADSIRATIHASVRGEKRASLHYFLDDRLIGERRIEPSRSDMIDAPFHFAVDKNDLWWPAGSGNQALHRIRVEVRNATGDVLDKAQCNIGFRSVELRQEADSIGRSFTFVINGVPTFMKGCNIVPPDMFPSRAGDSAWVALVASAQRANMNMVRIWAGGIYPPDAFFDACDTAGILVWQDFMLSNLVPAEGAFLDNVLAESREQVVRLSTHPSVALLCGNNELAVAWKNWGWQKKYDLHGADSARVFQTNHDLWARQLAEVAHDAGLPYTWTSPLSNWGNAAGLRNGDLHYWGVWHGDEPIAAMAENVGRFVSEYGFQSWPDSALLAKYIDPKQLYLGSPALQYRQRSYKTDAPIWKAIKEELGEEPKTLGRFITDSQEVQANAYQIAIKAQMAAQPRCMGTLFWQLNDCWPGPSWSLIDHDGHWKPGMFAVQKLYAR